MALRWMPETFDSVFDSSSWTDALTFLLVFIRMMIGPGYKSNSDPAAATVQRLLLVLTGAVSLLSLCVLAGHAQEDGLLDRGIRSFENENYEQAITQLSQYVSEESDPRAYLYLGHAHYFMESYDQARSMYQKARTNGLSDAQADVYTARVTIAEDQPLEALETLRPLTGHKNVGTLAIKLIARALERTQLYDLASHTYRRMYAEQSGEEAVLKKLYSLYMKQEQFGRANQYARHLLQDNFLDPEYLLFSASSALEQGEIRPAEVHLELARRLGRVDTELFRTLADIKSKRENYPEAIHYYELLLDQLESPRARDQYRLGISYLETDQFGEAETWLFRAARQDASYLSGVLRLIRRLHETRPIDRIQQLLEKAHSTFPDARKLHILEGNIHLEEENPEQSFQAFSNVPLSALNDRNTLYNYAYAAVKSRHRDQALSILADAIARYPGHQPFRQLLDRVLDS